MRTVYKYPITDIPMRVQIPDGAKILDAQMQEDIPTLWAEVETDNQRVVRTFFIVATGQPLPKECARYIATMQDGPLVWHVYEVSEVGKVEPL